jgi:uncharacterized protein
MDSFFSTVLGRRIAWGMLAVVSLLALFLLVNTIASLMGLRYIGSGITPTNTIVVSGEGEAYAVPDLGEFTFSVMSQKATVKAAQDEVTAKANAITDYLESVGVDEKDIKTVDYSVYPRYEYNQAVCPADSRVCPPGNQTLVGYEVRQTTQIKVRDTSKAGDLLAAVGGKGATEVSGLQFTVDDPTAVQNEARDEAIADAKEKADKLADQLGVRVVRVVAFNESGSGMPPMYTAYGKGGGAEDRAVAQVAPEISTGQNKVTSNVSITYEIR